MSDLNAMGDRYFNGDGVEQSYETAFGYYLKAAEAGEPEGYDSLGWCYSRGLGTDKSETNAIVNFSKAGEMGLARGWRHLAFMLFFSVTSDTDPRMAESFKYMLKAADMGDADAQAHVAQAYQYGTSWGAPGVDYAKAREYLTKAVEQENDHAMWVLAENYSTGSCGYEEDPALALKYYRKAAEAGSSKAMHAMGQITYFGLNGVEENQEEALSWEMKAYSDGDTDDNAVTLGALLMHGMTPGTADADYRQGRELIEGCCGENAVADYLMHRIAIVEKNYGKVPPEMMRSLLFLALLEEHHTEYERAEEEILVEAQAPRAINMALDGDFDACCFLSQVFLGQSEANMQYGGDKVSSLGLSEKWAEQAYKCDKLRGLDVYISSLGLMSLIDYQIGGYDYAEEKLVVLCRLLEEARALPEYDGLARNPKNYADYYTSCAFAQIKTHHYDAAYRNLMRANQEYMTSDALFGLFHLYSTEEFSSFDWAKAVDYIQKAYVTNNWMSESRSAEAHYILGMMYKEPAFGDLVRTDMKLSHDMMVRSAELGFDAAKEELPHYKQTLFGGYKYV